MSDAGLTAIILTWNEEPFLAGCIDSITPLTRDILVFDSGSTDRTTEIAGRLGARVEHRSFDGFASQRNAALQMADRAAWVLFVDADERITARLAREIRSELASAPDGIAGYWIPRRNIAFGRRLRGGGWWPDHQARLLRPGRAHYDPDRQVHEVVRFDEETRYLTSPMIHLNYTTRREFLVKQRRYTEQRARQLARMGVRPRRRAYLSGPAREFWRRFVKLGGYRDGLTGAFLALVLAGEELRGCWLLRNERRP